MILTVDLGPSLQQQLTKTHVHLLGSNNHQCVSVFILCIYVKSLCKGVLEFSASAVASEAEHSIDIVWCSVRFTYILRELFVFNCSALLDFLNGHWSQFVSCKKKFLSMQPVLHAKNILEVLLCKFQQEHSVNRCFLKG